jgi:transposase
LYSDFIIEEKDVLNLYYSREHIEQVFDISKNNDSMLPLRTHKTYSTIGHLLVLFIALIIYLELNNKL